MSCCFGKDGESSLNLRFADCGRGNGEDESGSKAGSSEGFRKGSSCRSMESASVLEPRLLCGEDMMEVWREDAGEEACRASIWPAET